MQPLANVQVTIWSLELCIWVCIKCQQTIYVRIELIWRQLINVTEYTGILGLLIMSILLLYRIRGALLIGIVFIAITSWPRVNKVTLFPYTETGDSMFNYFKQVVTLPSLDM